MSAHWNPEREPPRSLAGFRFRFAAAAGQHPSITSICGDILSLTFIFPGFDERDLGGPWRQVVRAAVRAWRHTPLPGAASLTLPVPSPGAPPTAPPHGPAHAAVGPAAPAPRLVYLFIVAVLLFVVLRHGFPLPQAAHRDVHLPLSPDCLRRGKKHDITRDKRCSIFHF